MNRMIKLLLASLVSLVAIAGPAAAQAEGDLVLEDVDVSGFPLVRAVVSGPTVNGSLDGSFVVSEDGEERPVDVVRLRSNDLNVVVALDISGSMEGDPLAKAKVAIGSLLETLPEEVPVSIVTFGDGANVQSPFTVDRDATLASVNGVVAAGQTALFDGIELGLSQLSIQGGTGALVVLADGADSVSTTTLDETVDGLASSGARVSFVALETFDFNADALDTLAEAADGEILKVDNASKFSEALRSVAAGLGNVYELRWPSASTGESAEIDISLASDPSQKLSATFEHDAVTKFVPNVATETHTVEAGGIFSAGWVPLIAALLVCAGAAVIIWNMRTSTSAVERRQERAAGKEFRQQERKRRFDGVQGRLNDISAQVLEVNDRGRSLDDILDRAGLAVRANEFVVFCTAIVLGSLVLGVFLFGIPFFLLGLLLPAIGIPMTLKVLTGRRRKAFINQLGDTLQLITGSLTAGYGLGQTLDSVSREAESPTKEEFARVVMETRLGRTLEDALDAMSLRIQAPDFDWVVDAIKIQASVGGNLSEILEQVGETIRARVRIKRQVDALTAEGKISALVLFCLPFALCGFIATSNPAYIEPLLSSTTGYIMLGVAGTMLTVGGLWLKKLVNPEF